MSTRPTPPKQDDAARTLPAEPAKDDKARKDEIGGPPGPEPTRFGDWERKGRCIDF